MRIIQLKDEMLNGVVGGAFTATITDDVDGLPDRLIVGGSAGPNGVLKIIVNKDIGPPAGPVTP